MVPRKDIIQQNDSGEVSGEYTSLSYLKTFRNGIVCDNIVNFGYVNPET